MIDMKKSFPVLKYIILILVMAGAFIAVYYSCFDVDFHNTGGNYMAVSASTIKFVNQWLSEGALKLHFTCYEYFESIEFNSYRDRCPYLSYPTGSTFVVWLLAKMAGRVHIGISFLKHIQAVFFGVETVTVALFVYLFLSQIKFQREFEKVFLSVVVAITWAYMPGNAWYLANVLFADQLIILYILLFILFEYINDTADNIRINKVVRILKVGIIYFGIMTDYYFWIFIFLIFLFKIGRFIVQRKKIKQMVRGTFEYTIPVIMGVATFIWQISYTEGWIDILRDKFIYRTRGEVSGSLFESFCKMYVCNEQFRGWVLLAGGLGFVAAVIIALTRKKSISRIFVEPGISVIIVSIVAPIIQVLFLRNHSINHEFSMVKMAWIIALFPVFYVAFTQWETQTNHNNSMLRNGQGISITCMRTIFVIMLLGYVMKMPFATEEYLEKNEWKENYEMEEALSNIADYDDVCFSFDTQILYDDSMRLAISEKCIYQINDVVEIEEKISKINGKVDKIYFIIDKLAEDSNLKHEYFKTKIMKTKECIYEDGKYCVVSLE